MNPPRAVAMSFPFSARRLAASLLLTFLSITPLLAADVTWDNGFGNFLWDLSSPNWSGALWNNAPGNGAVFGATGAGAINVSAPINVDSLGFLANGYTLNGTGPITFVKGSSTLGTGNVFVDTGLTATINAPINSSLGLTKRGQGTLQLGGPITFSGLGRVVTPGTNILAVDIYAGGISGQTPSAYSGITRIMNTSVLPTTTRLGVSNGLFDFGALNQTLGSITFNNDQDSFAFNPATRTAGVGLTGTGTLRVTGDINVLGNVTATNNGANSIANNVDFGGGTQVFRVSSSSIQAQGGALQMTGILSNGSLLKTLGFNQNGVMVAADGIGLFGNNTYTGSTRISGGTNVVTGTNASTSVEVIGSSNGSVLSLQGANGSYLSATTIQAVSGATFQIDNNASLAGFNPITPGAQNNNRLSDTVQLQLRDAGFLYRGLANTAATETIGSLAVSGGHNVFNMATSGTGTVALTVANNFTMTPRSSLAFNIITLGGTTQLFVNGTTPAADATGILPRVVTTSDFVTYNGATGLTPYTGYATDFSTPGTNVSVTAASTVASSVNINALKRGTASFTTTLGAGVTLGVTSGMILSTGGTGTFTGGTIAFGSAPGAFFGTNTVSSAITGTSGLLNALGTLTLNGDLSGLTGTMTQNGFGTTALATNTFAGPIEVREGTFNINTSQTLAGQGAITLGVAANDVDMVGAPPLLSISGAGANATIARDIIVNNGSLTNAGVRLGNAFMTGLSPLSNTTGSQTVSGNISVLSPF
ncbi:MAG: beta strand repeat-containing protein, partial [Chthoniobacterales bacterium]